MSAFRRTPTLNYLAEINVMNTTLGRMQLHYTAPAGVEYENPEKCSIRGSLKLRHFASVIDFAVSFLTSVFLSLIVRFDQFLKITS